MEFKRESVPQTDVIPLLPPSLRANPLIFEQGNPLYQETPPPLISDSLGNAICSPARRAVQPGLLGSLSTPAPFPPLHPVSRAQQGSRLALGAGWQQAPSG